MWKKILINIGILSALSGCGYNSMQAQDEAANASWSEVLNQYQRRADLVPSLVNTVKGYATHENSVLTQVTEARAKVGSMRVDENLVNDEQKLKQFNAAQGQLSSALSRLMVVSENYPQLKADANFRDLQAQLEGTENRIATARNRYIDAIREYNTSVRSFPNNLTAMIFGLKSRANFSVENEQSISSAPNIDFNTQPPTKN
jgi:LemA protein